MKLCGSFKLKDLFVYFMEQNNTWNREMEANIVKLSSIEYMQPPNMISCSTALHLQPHIFLFTDQVSLSTLKESITTA